MDEQLSSLALELCHLEQMPSQNLYLDPKEDALEICQLLALPDLLYDICRGLLQSACTTCEDMLKTDVLSRIPLVIHPHAPHSMHVLPMRNGHRVI